MKASSFFYLFILFTTPLLSQNLIPNNSFELTKKEVDFKIASSQDDFNQKAQDWYSPTDASPDIYKTPKDNNQYPSDFRLPEPPDGEGLVGLILNTPEGNPKCSNYKEYIQIKLNKPLEIDTTYVLEFWLYGRTFGRYQIGAHFSPKAIYSTDCGVLVDKPSQTIYNDILNEARWGKWKKVVYGFKATSADAYLTIGNFSKNTFPKAQYCYLDNIYLAKYKPKAAQKTNQPKVKKKERVTDTSTPINKPLPVKEIFNPINVQFEYGSSTLTEAAQMELDKLITYLRQEVNLSLRIEGHTDNSGSSAFNQTLAMQRAILVRNYLASKGIKPTRLKALGYGASRPIADNDTVEGAGKNRRVEFKLRN